MPRAVTAKTKQSKCNGQIFTKTLYKNTTASTVRNTLFVSPFRSSCVRSLLFCLREMMQKFVIKMQQIVYYDTATCFGWSDFPSIYFIPIFFRRVCFAGFCLNEWRNCDAVSSCTVFVNILSVHINCTLKSIARRR